MKKVLVISYYWPPAGGPGVQRWLKFVSYFRDFGIEPILYAPQNPHYPIVDETLESEVPEGLEIIRKPIKEPYKYAQLFFRKKTNTISSGIIDEKDPSFLEKLMLYARGNLFIPDARVGWVKPSVSFLTYYLKHHPEIKTVITTGPPHSLHLIGMRLKKVLNIRWIADFRDPWTHIHYHKSLRLSKKAQLKHERLEQKVLQRADSVVVTSPSTQADFQKITEKPVVLITNGFDQSKAKTSNLDEAFSLVHVGSFLSNRNPVFLWKVLSELTAENVQFKQDLEIKLVGLVSKEVKQSLETFGLLAHATFPGYVSHIEAELFQYQAQLLLLVEMNRPETKAILPGKLFEYLRSRRPILAIGPQGSDMESILKKTQAGHFYEYGNSQAVKDLLLQYYHQYQQTGIATVSGEIEAYSRKAVTQQMAELIKSL